MPDTLDQDVWYATLSMAFHHVSLQTTHSSANEITISRRLQSGDPAFTFLVQHRGWIPPALRLGKARPREENKVSYLEMPPPAPPRLISSIPSAILDPCHCIPELIRRHLRQRAEIDNRAAPALGAFEDVACGGLRVLWAVETMRSVHVR